MGEVFLALGRGLVKLFIGILGGAGVGLLVFGLTTRGRPEIWRSPDPPAEFFVALGAGGLTAAGLLLLLFGIPWLRRNRQGHRGVGGPPPRTEPWVEGRPPATDPPSTSFKA
jgi:hypothetical protein